MPRRLHPIPPATLRGKDEFIGKGIISIPVKPGMLLMIFNFAALALAQLLNCRHIVFL
jgi:hypothetical protein